MVVVAETVAVAVVMIMIVAAVGMSVSVIVVVLVNVLVVVIHASIPLAGSAMCSNMVESRLLMWASAAA